MEDIIPKLAESLAQLHQAPGDGDDWVDYVLRGLKKKRRGDYFRLGRRLGFAEKLADLVGLDEPEEAALTTGLFFDAVLGDKPSLKGNKPPGLWGEYLLRSSVWQASSLRIIEILRLPEASDSVTGAVARMTIILDREISNGHGKFEVAPVLAEEAITPAAVQVAHTLLSPEGQELCAGHYAQKYEVEVGQILDSMSLLQNIPPGPIGEYESPADVLQAEDLTPEDADATKDVPNILRTSPEKSATELDREIIQSTPAPEEDGMQDTRITSDATEDLREQLAELRTRLQQIAQSAAEGERLLDAFLASQNEQSSAWVAELESMLGRWKGDVGAGGKAA